MMKPLLFSIMLLVLSGCVATTHEPPPTRCMQEVYPAMRAAGDVVYCLEMYTQSDVDKLQILVDLLRDSTSSVEELKQEKVSSKTDVSPVELAEDQLFIKQIMTYILYAQIQEYAESAMSTEPCVYRFGDWCEIMNLVDEAERILETVKD